MNARAIPRSRLHVKCHRPMRKQLGGACVVRLVDQVVFRANYFERSGYDAEAWEGGFGDWAGTTGECEANGARKFYGAVEDECVLLPRHVSRPELKTRRGLASVADYEYEPWSHL